MPWLVPLLLYCEVLACHIGGVSFGLITRDLLLVQTFLGHHPLFLQEFHQLSKYVIRANDINLLLLLGF